MFRVQRPSRSAEVMADDGMLLNFSDTGPPSTSQPKFHGGSWKDRLAARKKATDKHTKGRNLNTKLNLSSSLSVQPVDDYAALHEPSDFQSPKRLKRTGSFQPTSDSASQPPLDRRPIPSSGCGSQPRGREVISSLFTYNPKPSIVRSNEQKDEVHGDIQASNAPLPDGIDSFTSLGLKPSIAAHLLTKMEIRTPTGIQKSCIPQLLKEDADAFIQSETGSGKTLAYLLPIVQKIIAISEQSKPTNNDSNTGGGLSRTSGLLAIILAPTRELCKQISVALERLLGCAHWLVAGTVIGGEKKKSEKARLRKGINVLVATPGRLSDHLENTKAFDASAVRWLVLDEGDRLMDLGFEEQIQKIVQTLDAVIKPDSSLAGLPQKRNTILCSATMKMNVQRLGEISLKDAIMISPSAEERVESVDESKNSRSHAKFSAPAQLKQSYAVVPAKLRLVTLTALLKRTFARKGSVMKSIVFLSCADSVDFHFNLFAHSFSLTTSDNPNALRSIGHNDGSSVSSAPVLSSSTNAVTLYKLHGSLSQQTRTSIVRDFSRSRTAALLLATDVASRGLDLPNLDLVIEYDPSFSSDDHLHRIGRTARLGREGRATVFLLPGPEEGYVELLREKYRTNADTSPSLSHVSLNDILKRGFTSTTITSSGQNKITTSSNFENLATDFQLEAERLIQSSAQFSGLAKRAFQSHVRAYATHVATERQYFNIKDLHLGHLAKSFGLRDKPSNVNVQGMRTRKSSENLQDHNRKRNERAGDTIEPRKGRPEKGAGIDIGDAKSKMRQKMMEQMAGAAEFNVA